MEKKEVKMDKKELLILKQVSLKAAANLGGTKEEVVVNASFFNEWLLEGVDLTVTKVDTTSSDGFEPKCPACNSFVWDNRETASAMQPKWRCKNEDCTGGSFSKKYNKLMAWASWDEDEFANAELKYNKTNGVEDANVDSVNNAGEVEESDNDIAPF